MGKHGDNADSDGHKPDRDTPKGGDKGGKHDKGGK